MTQALEIAAGLDLHKKFIIATILTLAGGKMQERFERTHEGLLKLKDWILNNKVQAVGCESTSDYAVNIYDLLNQFIPVIVGNARDIKAFTHKKTDKVDSEFIALLTLKGMIHPSRIMPMDLKEFSSVNATPSSSCRSTNDNKEPYPLNSRFGNVPVIQRIHRYLRESRTYCVEWHYKWIYR